MLADIHNTSIDYLLRKTDIKEPYPKRRNINSIYIKKTGLVNLIAMINPVYYLQFQYPILY